MPSYNLFAFAMDVSSGLPPATAIASGSDYVSSDGVARTSASMGPIHDLTAANIDRAHE